MKICRCRGIASGISVSANYAFGFISKKIYYKLETTLSLPGVSLLYCIIIGVGLILMYFIMPETDGRTLEDIELHFSDNSKKLTDWWIHKSEALEKYINANDVEKSTKILAINKIATKEERMIGNYNKMDESCFDNKAFVMESMKL